MSYSYKCMRCGYLMETMIQIMPEEARCPRCLPMTVADLKGADLSDEMYKKLKAEWESRHTGIGRGRVTIELKKDEELDHTLDALRYSALSELEKKEETKPFSLADIAKTYDVLKGRSEKLDGSLKSAIAGMSVGPVGALMAAAAKACEEMARTALERGLSSLKIEGLPEGMEGKIFECILCGKNGVFIVPKASKIPKMCAPECDPSTKDVIEIRTDGNPGAKPVTLTVHGRVEA